MEAEGSARDLADPIRGFADRLRRLQVESGGPSVRELVRLTEKVGMPYTRGTIQDKLAGRSAAPWEFTVAFVRACALHTGIADSPDLRPWRAWHAQMERELAALRAGRRRPVRPDTCPYRGLESFTAEHASWFHGRAGAVQQLLAGLSAHRPGLLLLGPSGAGKSSLVQAGMLPALADGGLPGSDRWIVVPARPGKGLLAELQSAGLSEVYRRSITGAVADRLAGEPASARLLLIVDQFEELLTPATSDEQEVAQREAIAQLTAAAGAPGLSLVLVLRDDFYPRLAAQAPRLLGALTPGLLNVPATLDPQDLYEIVTRPAEAVGLECQDDLPERIVADVLSASPQGTIARQAPVTMLPLLELTLHQLWLRRRDGRLTHEAYHRVGGVAGAVTTWCDTAVDELSSDQRQIARQILTSLVRPADDDHEVPAVRQQVPLPALRALAAPTDLGTSRRPVKSDEGSTEATVDDVLDVLIERRIVTTRTAGQPDGSPGVPVAELVHEALIRDWASLRNWVDQDHRFQDWLRRAEERHARWAVHHDKADLPQGRDLAEGLAWSAQRRLPDHLAAFLAAGRHGQRAEIRRSRRLNAVLAGLLVTALVAVGLTLWQRQSTLAAQRTALSRQLAAQSANLLSTDPDLAGLLAVQAYRTSATAEATASVYAAAAQPLTRRLIGHTDAVQAVAFAPDGRTLATGSGDGSARLWDPATGQVRTILVEGARTVTAVAFSPDGRTLATAGTDTATRLWDIASGQLRATVNASAYALAFSPDGRSLATGSLFGSIQLWDAATGHVRATLIAHAGSVYALAFSPDGRTLAVASENPKAELWDVADGRIRARLTGHDGAVFAIAFAPDGRTVATGGTDTTVRLWDTAGGRLRTTLTGHTDAVQAVAFSPDRQTLATGSADGLVRLWEVPGGQFPNSLTGHANAVYAVAFSPDGRTLATGSLDRTVRLWDVGTGRIRTTLTGGAANTVVYSPDGSTLATGSRDGSTRLWDVATGQVRQTLTGHTGAVPAVAYSSDGRTLATGGADGSVRVWDVGSGQIRGAPVCPGDEVFALAFSPDGHTLATGYRNDKVQLCDVASRKVRARFDAGFVYALAFSPDGRTLATGDGEDNRLALWSVSDGRLRAAMSGRFVYTVAFSPDGQTLATAGADHTVRLWNVADGQPRASLSGHTEAVYTVAFSPDGDTVASGGEDGTIRLWDVAGGQLRTTLPGHTESVDSVAFSPDGQTLAAADNANEDAVRLWDVALPSLPDALDKVCRSVGRDLDAHERMKYLGPDPPSDAVCRRRT